MGFTSLLHTCILLFVLFLKDITLQVKAGANPQLTRTLQHYDNQVFIYDNVFSRQGLSIMSSLVSRYAPFDFIYPEKLEGLESNENGNLHWIANFSPADFAKSKIWKTLVKRLSGVFKERDFLPYEAQSVLINRGDFPSVQKAKRDGDLLLRIFLTQGQKKNDYSELVFFDENEEIFGSVFPKFGRTVVWNDTVDFIFKPPSMQKMSGEYSLFIKATLNKTKFEKSVNKFKEQASLREQISKEPFPLSNITDNSVYSINLTNHLVRRFYDSNNRVVAVFDDVIPKEILFALRKYFFQYDSSYVYNVYDPAYSEEHDNVNWVAQVPAELLPKSQVWRYIHHIASYVSNETNWHPYDVSMNIIQHTHHPRIHTDCSTWEHEYTILMYLTPEWKEDMYGETIFFEEVDKHLKKKRNFKAGNEKYETLGAVIPKFGRIVIFRNIVDHSGRPPSPDFLAARYTFPVKIGRSPEIAIAKKLRELLSDFVEEGKEGYKLMNDLEAGKYDTSGDAGNEEFLNKKYLHFKKTKEKVDYSDRKRLYNMLSMSPIK